MTALAVFVLAGIGTYAARAAFIVGVGDRTLHPVLERALRMVGPAVLAALLASLLTSPDGVDVYVSDLPAVVGTIVAILVAWRTRRFDLTFVAGVVVYYGLVFLP